MAFFPETTWKRQTGGVRTATPRLGCLLGGEVAAAVEQGGNDGARHIYIQWVYLTAHGAIPVGNGARVLPA